MHRWTTARSDLYLSACRIITSVRGSTSVMWFSTFTWQADICALDAIENSLHCIWHWRRNLSVLTSLSYQENGHFSMISTSNSEFFGSTRASDVFLYVNIVIFVRRLSELQLDARRRGLEQYLEKVCAVRVIAESDIMQEFLADRLEEDGDQGPAVDLKVLLPDREVVTITVAKAASVSDVYDAVCSRVGLDAETAKYFYLFEIVEYNFGTLFGSKFSRSNYLIQWLQKSIDTRLYLL